MIASPRRGVRVIRAYDVMLMNARLHDAQHAGLASTQDEAISRPRLPFWHLNVGKSTIFDPM